MNKTIEVLIDEHGKGEQQFSIPCEWEDSHKLNEITPRYFYLKTGDLEFPRAYYVANPNKTEEENKSKSNRIKALMLKVAITNSANDWEESDNAVILGEELLLEENVGERCEPLIWGKKFSCAEREKVIEIAAQLWGENNKLKMANELMGCIALETGGVFTADVTKGDGLGLIQFTGTAVDDMNKQGYSNGKKLTKVMLGNMTVLEQLDYVKLYFDMHISHYKRTIKDAMDMYMCILCPAAVGKDDSFVLYSKEKDKKNEGKNYKKNASIDGEYYKEKGNLVLKGTANDEITRGELKPRLLMWTAKGIIKMNTCKTDASTCAFGTRKGTYKEGIWRNPIDSPQITIYTAGGNKRPWRSAFGDVRRDIRSAGLNHSGLDLFANIGTDVFASLPGTVTAVEYQAGGAGHYLKIKVLDDYVAKFHELRRNYSPYYVKSARNYDQNKYDIKNYPDFIEQVGVTNSTEVHFVYMHLKSGSINVKKGDIISESDYKTKVIAQTGDSGASGTKGPHLHFEIRNGTSGSKFNPAYYVDYKNETELTAAERQVQDAAAGK